MRVMGWIGFSGKTMPIAQILSLLRRRGPVRS